LSAAETTAPAANLTCTAAVSQMPPCRDNPHSARSAGTTAEAENHIASTSTCVSASSAS
jgi:hypothetical protein